MSSADQDMLTFDLRKPVKLGDLEYTALHLREATAGELLEIDGLTGWAKKIKKIELVSAMPGAALEKVKLRDLRRADAYLSRFAEIGEIAGPAGEVPDEFSVTLRKPVAAEGKTFTALHLREPDAGQMIALDKFKGWDADLRAISLIADIPLEALRQVGERDALMATDYLSRFFTDAPSTGADA